MDPRGAGRSGDRRPGACHDGIDRGGTQHECAERVWREFWTSWRRNLVRAQIVLGVPALVVVAVCVVAIGSFGHEDPFRRGLAAGYLLLALLLWCWLVHLPLALRTVAKRRVVATWRAGALDVSLAPLPAVGAGVLSLLLVLPQVLLAPAALVFFGASAPAYVIARLTAVSQHRSRERLDLVEGKGEVRAREARGGERERLWDRFREYSKSGDIDALASLRSREIPVVILEQTHHWLKLIGSYIYVSYHIWMSLRHSILGLLAIRPMSGYELKKVIAESVGHFWTADQSQIYRTLAKLVDDGLASRRTVVQEERPNLHLHTVTDTGLAELDRWVASPMQSPPLREPFLTRLFFADRLPTDEICELLSTRKQEVSAKLAALEAIAVTSNDAHIGHVLRLATLANGIAHARAELDWLDATKRQLERIAP